MLVVHEALHCDAPDADQESVEEAPSIIELGEAEKATVGAGTPPLSQVLVSSQGSAVKAKTEVPVKLKIIIINTNIIKSFLYIVFIQKLINQ